MTRKKLPKFETIEELAEFFDTHDMTDFDGEFELVKEPVFVRQPAIKLYLETRHVQAVGRMARAKGVSRETLIREWVLEKLARKRPPRKSTRSA